MTQDTPTAPRSSPSERAAASTGRLNRYVPRGLLEHLASSPEQTVRSDDGTMVCCFSPKKSRNDCRICAEVMMLSRGMGFQPMSHRQDADATLISKWKYRRPTVILHTADEPECIDDG